MEISNYINAPYNKGHDNSSTENLTLNAFTSHK